MWVPCPYLAWSALTPFQCKSHPKAQGTPSHGTPSTSPRLPLSSHISSRLERPQKQPRTTTTGRGRGVAAAVSAPAAPRGKQAAPAHAPEHGLERECERVVPLVNGVAAVEPHKRVLGVHAPLRVRARGRVGWCRACNTHYCAALHSGIVKKKLREREHELYQIAMQTYETN